MLVASRKLQKVLRKPNPVFTASWRQLGMPNSKELKIEAKVILGCNENDAHTKSIPSHKHGRLVWYLCIMCVVDKIAFVEISNWRHDNIQYYVCNLKRSSWKNNDHIHQPISLHQSTLPSHPLTHKQNSCLMIWGISNNSFCCVLAGLSVMRKWISSEPNGVVSWLSFRWHNL